MAAFGLTSPATGRDTRALFGGHRMSTGRRGLILALTFLVPAVWLCPGQRAHAQPGGFRQNNDPGAGRHAIWQKNLTPEQIRNALSKFGQDDGKNDWFEDLVRDAVRNKNPNVNEEQVKAKIQELLSNKEFMDRVTDLAQKHKNERPNNANPPRLTREDLAKLAQLKPDGRNGDPFVVPDPPANLPDPNLLPPFDPRNPRFDPKQVPKIDPDNPPQFDPNTKFPLHPDTGRPFDPRNGRPIDPKNPPKIEPPPTKFDPVAPALPKFEPAVPPKFDPNAGGPPPNANDNIRRFDPDNPLGAPPDSPEKIAKAKAAEAATALWEKNVGPIDETPAVKRAILDLIADPEAMDALTDGRGNNVFDTLSNEGKGGDKDGDLFGKLFGDGSGWEWPKFDFGWSRGRDLDLDTGPTRSRDRNYTSRDSSRSRGGSSGSLEFGSVKIPFLLLLVLAALVTAAVVWWKWGAVLRSKPRALLAGGPNAWPIDPRQIKTREDVVKAFEFLSVLICGPGAKTWTHSTIADELTTLAASQGETAMKLARLYELARYAPLDEPPTRVELLEARRLVCDLAGVDEV